jgi:hypothetical protein
MNLPINACNIWFINLIKILGILVSPKGMTNNSYKPYLVLKTGFHSSPYFILIWGYSLLRLVLENKHDPCNLSSLLSNIRIKCL